MFKEIKIILLSLFFCLGLQTCFAMAAVFDNPARVYDFIHLARDKSSADYKVMHDFLKECSREKKAALIDYASGPDAITPLHEAVNQVNYAAVYFLLQHGADVTLKTTNGYTALEEAEDYASDLKVFFDLYAYSREKREEQVECLTQNQSAEAGNYIFSKIQSLFFHILIDWNELEMMLSNYPEKWIREELLTRYDESGRTLLCKAIKAKSINWIVFLLKHNVDSHCMFRPFEFLLSCNKTAKDYIRAKIDAHAKQNEERYQEHHCFFCDDDRNILLLLEVYEACFEKREV